MHKRSYEKSNLRPYYGIFVNYRNCNGSIKTG